MTSTTDEHRFLGFPLCLSISLRLCASAFISNPATMVSRITQITAPNRFHLYYVLLAHGKKRTEPRATALPWGLVFF
jgi:hypothetical protein